MQVNTKTHSHAYAHNTYMHKNGLQDTYTHTHTCTQCGPALGSQVCNEALVKVYQGG